MIHAISKGKEVSTLLKDIMSSNVLYCFEDDQVEHAANNMSKNQIRRLVVLSKNKRLTGVISLGDVARKIKDQKTAGETIKAILKWNLIHRILIKNNFTNFY